MKKLIYVFLFFGAIGFGLFSCQKASLDVENKSSIPQSVIDQLMHLGFNPDGIERVDNGYRIERDIIITEEFLKSDVHFDHLPNTEQYRTNNLVSTGGNRTITVYIDAPPAGGSGSVISQGRGNGNGNGNGGGPGGGGTQFDQTYADALADALGRFNSENLEITFERIDNKNAADIQFTRLGKRDERRGVLGSAGFPSGGDPYGEVRMSGIIPSYNWSQEAIATVMAHELGHCIGFRHTDYFDRSISCGGSTANEGDGGVGAVHIPGTPTGATRNAGSWMLSCSDGSDRQFNNDDKTALDFLY